jgi:hypothetical protein
MASTNGHYNSLDELERDAERTRADLAHTVDELRSRISDTASDIRERVSPAAIKQDVKDYVHQTGQQLYHTVEARARENPLQAVAIAAGLAYPFWRIVSSMPAPILLIGAGIALSSRTGQSAPANRMLDQARDRLEGATAEIRERSRYASTAMQDASRNTTESVQDAALRARGAVQDTTQRAKEALQDATQRTKEQVADAASRAGAAVTSTVDTVASTVTDAVSGARDAVSRAASTVTDAVSSSYQSSAEAAAYAREQALWASRQTRETFVQTMDRHPLLVGGVGLALGALLASAIPSTAPERRMFGETNEELQRRAREMASRGYDAARNAAGELVDDTVRAAKEQGLSVDALREAADELGGKMRSVAEKATGVASPDKQSNAAGSQPDAAGSAAAPKII